jgi:hypothetical protein
MKAHSGIYGKTKDFINECRLDLMFSFVDDTVRIFSLNILGIDPLKGSAWKKSAHIGDLCFDLGHPCSIHLKRELYSFYYRDKNVPTIDWDSFYEIQDVDFVLGVYYIIMPISDWSDFLTRRGKKVSHKTSKEVDKYRMMESLSG